MADIVSHYRNSLIVIFLILDITTNREDRDNDYIFLDLEQRCEPSKSFLPSDKYYSESELVSLVT